MNIAVSAVRNTMHKPVSILIAKQNLNQITRIV